MDLIFELIGKAGWEISIFDNYCEISKEENGNLFVYDFDLDSPENFITTLKEEYESFDPVDFANNACAEKDKTFEYGRAYKRALGNLYHEIVNLLNAIGRMV